MGVAAFGLVLYFPNLGGITGLRETIMNIFGSEEKIWMFLKGLACVHGAMMCVTFHFTYNILRLYKDPIIGWQLITAIFGFSALKKLYELIYAKDLIGDSPYRCT